MTDLEALDERPRHARTADAGSPSPPVTPPTAPVQSAGASPAGAPSPDGRLARPSPGQTTGRRRAAHRAADIRNGAQVNHSLDVLRGIAALLVVISHARLYTLHVLDMSPEALPRWLKLALAPTYFGKEAVAIFFVLSGYLVGGSVVRQLRGSRFDPTDYGVKRLSRLWSVLIPAIGVTALIDAISRWGFDSDAYSNVAGRDNSPATAVCNAAFLMPTRCSTYGSNDALWSLGYEFWFYIVFAAAAFAFAAFARRRWLPGIAGLAVTAGSLALFGVTLLELIPAWLIGVGVAALPTSRVRRARLAIASAVAVLAAAMVGTTATGMTEREEFVVIGVAAVPLLWLLVAANPAPSRRDRPFRLMAWIGTWSYSIYAFHLPLVVLFALAATRHLPYSAGLLAVYIYGTAAVVVAAVYPLYLASERNLPTWRAAMMRLVGRTS